jgi:hypothetical protein
MRSRNNSSNKKSLIVTYCECVSVALFIHLAQQLRHFTPARLACQPVTFRSTFFNTCQECREKMNIKYML